MPWICPTCGVEHDELPLCYGAEAPWRELVSEDEFDRRVELTGDQCIVDERIYFIRGHIELPVEGGDVSFAWSVWCSLSEESFAHAHERWNDPERDGDRYFGWLCTSLPTYQDSTLNLKTTVRSRPPGAVPEVLIHECEHPLFAEQRDGVSRTRVAEIAHTLLHG